jgi:hypothetical protein
MLARGLFYCSFGYLLSGDAFTTIVDTCWITEWYRTAYSYCRNPFCLAACAPAAGEVFLAHSASRSTTVQGHRGRAGQQYGADRLGVAGQGWGLSGAPTRRRLTRSSAMGG